MTREETSSLGWEGEDADGGSSINKCYKILVHDSSK
jgi:hypothetical protein